MQEQKLLRMIQNITQLLYGSLTDETMLDNRVVYGGNRIPNSIQPCDVLHFLQPGSVGGGAVFVHEGS